MPRKWTLIMEAWPDLLPARRYRARVVRVEPTKGPPAMEVTVEHLGRGQTGRRQAFALALPLRPGTLAEDFLKACGLHLDQASPVTPQDAIGAVIFVRFGQPAEDVELQPIAFESASKKEHKDAGSTA